MLSYLKSNIAEWLLLQMVIYEKCSQWNWCQTFCPQALFTFILLTIYQGLLQHEALSHWHYACLYFLKWFCFLFSYSSAANYSCSLFYFNPQSSLFSLGFAFTHRHNMFFFSILCLILFHIQPGEERPLPQRMKRLLELIFICCAVPMAFLECVMYYHQVLIMQLKCRKV